MGSGGDLREGVVKYLKISNLKKYLQAAQCHCAVLWCEKQIYSRYD